MSESQAVNLSVLKEVPPWEWGDDAAQQIMSVLRDDGASEADRLLAVELAASGTVTDDEMVEALLALVQGSSGSEELRGAAAIALGPTLETADLEGFEDLDGTEITQATFERVCETLHQVFQDTDLPKFVRRRVLEAAVRAPRDWQTDVVRKAYRSGDEDWVVTAVFCMRYLRDFETEILEALGSERELLVYEAVQAAGEWGVEGAWPRVLRFLKSSDTPKHLLLAAILASVNIRPDEALPIVDDFLDSEDEDIAETADEAMAFVESDRYRDGSEFRDEFDEEE